MPDELTEERAAEAEQTDAGGVFSGYGIASAVLGVIAVAALVVAALIWTAHRSEVDERAYQSRVLQAAADWTGVLINMNKDTVEASMQKLHEGTVGQLNADFDSAVEPYRQLVQTLQSQHHRPDRLGGHRVDPPQPADQRRPGAAAQAAARAVGVRLAHGHRDGRCDIGQRERRRQAADGALERFGSTSPTSTASC